MATASVGLVLVTGASGYVGGHVIKQLQETGHKVRGTVRSTKNEEKVKHMYNLCPTATHKLELVEADLEKPETWLDAVKGVTHVMHVASPFSLDQTDGIVQTAVDGTLNVLKACAEAGTVKRVVLTSSCAAVEWTDQGHDKAHDESSWSDVSKQSGYSKSKTVAEKSAWDYVDSLPAGKKFELVVINPSVILGPLVQGSSSLSLEIIKTMMVGQQPFMPREGYPTVDVRDVALAHVRAMTSDKAAGKRFICNNTTLGYSAMEAFLRQIFEPQGYQFPEPAPDTDVGRFFNNKRLREILKVEPRDARDTLAEMAYALIENDIVKKTPKYNGPWKPEMRKTYMKFSLPESKHKSACCLHGKSHKK